MVHVGLHSVGTYHKKFGGQNKKKYKYALPSVHRKHSAKTIFAESQLCGTRQRICFAECRLVALGTD
jgi:hypothetical protein